jgi:hypothetical protein
MRGTLKIGRLTSHRGVMHGTNGPRQNTRHGDPGQPSVLQLRSQDDEHDIECDNDCSTGDDHTADDVSSRVSDIRDRDDRLLSEVVYYRSFVS